MQTITIKETRNNLAELIEKVAVGNKTFIITKFGKAKAQLTPVSKNMSQKQKGFTLLFASLVGSLLLALGIATFNIILRELNLSSSARESRAAFSERTTSGWKRTEFKKKSTVFSPQSSGKN